MNNPFPKKPALSPFVAIAFLVISVTGVLLYFHVKNGPIIVLHEWFGWAFVVAGILHVLLNIKPLFAYLKLRSGLWSLAAALILTVILTMIGLNRHRGPNGQPPPFEQRR
jgi:hypothetical protein